MAAPDRLPTVEVMTTTQLPAPRLRASDADRTATAKTLQDAVGRGLLSPEEGGERLAAAFAAVYRDELPPLTADLPATAPAAPSAAVGWQAVLALLVAQVRAEITATRAAGLRSRRFAVAAVVTVLLVGLVVLGAVSGSGFEGGHPPFAGGHH
jgi:hypothetical protein